MPYQNQINPFGIAQAQSGLAGKIYESRRAVLQRNQSWVLTGINHSPYEANTDD